MSGMGGKAGGEGDDGAKTAAGAANATVSDVFGQIVWLMSQSPAHKNFFISDLEWMVMPPMLLRQFRIFPGKNQPLGVALWASLSPESRSGWRRAARGSAPTNGNRATASGLST